MRKQNSRHTAARLLIACGMLAGGTAASPASAFEPLPAPLTGSTADSSFARARQMWDEKNYAGVIDRLTQALGEDAPLWSQALAAAPVTQRQQAMALMLRALFERGDETEFRALRQQFLREYPEGPLSVEARLLGADFSFFRGDYPAAVREYSAIDLSALSPARADLYAYRLALSQIRTGYLSEAAVTFRHLERTGTYREPARFYLAYIDYAEGSCEKAKAGFRSVGEPYASQLGVPYYLAQIAFREGDYDYVLSLDYDAIVRANPEWEQELTRITGESYFAVGRKQKAAPFLQRYVEKTSSPLPTALYELGTIRYDEGDLSEAARLFAQVTDEGEYLAQSAYLYLGQIASARKDYTEAAMSFRRAYDMRWDPRVTETALYDYVVATISGGSVPFASSAPLMEDFIRKYPDSPYAAKVDEYLAAAYYNDHNYEAALAHTERLRNPSRQVLASKQKILFQLGMKAAGSSDYSAAAGYMERAAELHRYDSDLAAEALLWEGDALYAQKKYRAASDVYKRYLKSVRNGSGNRALGLYNLGYSLYQEQKFSEARKYFLQALKASPALPSRLASDARLRAADCDYYNGNVTSAMQEYRAMGDDPASASSDYAAFQYANMLGVRGDQTGKIEALRSMLAKFPDSQWHNDALLELSQAYIAKGDIDAARKIASQLDTEASSTVQSRQAALNLAAAYAEKGDQGKAIDAYKNIIRRWPTSAEASRASSDLKTIYTQMGDLQGYLSFLDTVPRAPRPDASEMDELTYRSAYKQYEKNPADTSALRDYLARYPNSVQAPAVLYLLAYDASDKGDDTAALQYLDKLTAGWPDSSQIPSAYSLKAQILQDSGRAAEAAAVWKQLLATGSAATAPDAYRGLMETASTPEEQIAYADRLLSLSGAASEDVTAATLCKGLAKRRLGRLDEAIRTLRPLASEPSTAEGAQAAVTISEILLRQGKAAQAQKELQQFIDSDTEEQYWMARGYIALSDAFSAQGDTYKAKEYLKALQSNYPGDEEDIAEMIRTRLAKLK